jgi:hypothetical protein
MSVLAWTYILVGLSFTLYLSIAWLSRVKDTAGSTSPAAASRRRSTAWPRAPTG